MNLKYINNCYKLVTTVTCLIPQNITNDWGYGLETHFNISENFNAVARYSYFPATDFVASYCESHYFYIGFFQGNEEITGIIFRKTIDDEPIGSLANPELSFEEKMKIICKNKPNLYSKLKMLGVKNELSANQINQIIKKTDELLEQASELNNNKKTFVKKRKKNTSV